MSKNNRTYIFHDKRAIDRPSDFLMEAFCDRQNKHTKPQMLNREMIIEMCSHVFVYFNREYTHTNNWINNSLEKGKNETAMSRILSDLNSPGY